MYVFRSHSLSDILRIWNVLLYNEIAREIRKGDVMDETNESVRYSSLRFYNKSKPLNV